MFSSSTFSSSVSYKGRVNLFNNQRDFEVDAKLRSVNKIGCSIRFALYRSLRANSYLQLLVEATHPHKAPEMDLFICDGIIKMLVTEDIPLHLH